MSDQQVQFLRDALSKLPSAHLTSETNPLTFTVAGVRYSAHISSVHDSGEGRDNNDEQRIQISRTSLETQASRRDQGYVPLFLGFFPDGAEFTAWEPSYALAQQPGKNGSVYARGSHGREALSKGVAVRVVKSLNLGRNTTVVTIPTDGFFAYLNAWQSVHSALTARAARQLLSSP
jgi:hypothetical protein